MSQPLAEASRYGPQDAIAYLVEENRVLKEQVKGRKLRLNGDQRRRLEAKGKRIGRRALDKIAAIVTPDTRSPHGLHGAAKATRTVRRERSRDARMAFTWHSP